jgi:uncharacterized membrane protein YgcG
LFSFLHNLYFFWNVKHLEVDKIFLNETKSFEEAISDITLLENYLKKDFKKQKERIAFYENNALRTKRKYFYYQDYIEPFFTKAFLGSKRKKKELYYNLDKPVQGFLIGFTVISILLLVLTIILGAFAIYNGDFVFGISLWIIGLGVVVRLYNFIIKLNYLLLLLMIDGILILFKKERGRLYKNINILDILTKGWWNSRGKAIMIGGTGSTSYSSFGGGGFGGVGGGSVGGGGAGGSGEIRFVFRVFN